MPLSATKSRKAHVALFLLLVLAAIALVVLPNAAQPARASSLPAEVQGAGTAHSTASPLTLAFTTTTVTSGDVLVAHFSVIEATKDPTPTVTDSRCTGNWAQETSTTHADVLAGSFYDYIYACTASSSGSDTVSVSFATDSVTHTLSILEASGVILAGAVAATPGYGTTTSPATGSTAFAFPYYLAIGGYAFDYGSSNSGNGAGAGYALFSSADPYGYEAGAEQSSTVSSPTTFPFSVTATGATYWVAVGIILAAATQPLMVSMSTGAPATVTITGCSATPSTFQSDGAVHLITMNSYGCPYTLSFSNSGNTRDGFSVSSSFSATSSAETSSATQLNLTAYEQVSESFAYSLAGGGSGYSAPVLTGTQVGASGTAVATLTTTPTAYWLDYSTGWSAPASLTGSGPSEKWTTASTSGTSSAGSSETVAYTNRYTLTVNGCNGQSISPASETGDSWWNSGDAITVTCNGEWSRTGGTGTRAISYNWNGGSNTAVLSAASFSPQITLAAAETLTVNPTTQYFVTLDSGATAALSSCNPTIPGDGCWYDSGTTAQITLNGVFNRGSGSGGRLEDWQLDSGSANGLTTTAQTTVQIPLIGAPHTIYTTTVTQYQVVPSAGLTLSRPTIANDTGWYDANAQVTITGEGGAATYVVSSPIWANQVSSYGMQLVTNAQAGSINYGSLTLVYTCSSCWTRLFIPTASGLSVQSVTQGGTYLSYSTQGFITSFSATGGSSAWEVYFGQVGSGGLPPAASTSTTTTSSTSSAAAGGLFSNPSTTSYLEIAGLVAVLVAAVAVLMLKDKQGARNIVIKIRNKVG